MRDGFSWKHFGVFALMVVCVEILAIAVLVGGGMVAHNWWVTEILPGVEEQCPR